MTTEMETICCTGHLQFPFRVLTFSNSLPFSGAPGMISFFFFLNTERLPLIILRSLLTQKFYEALCCSFHNASYCVDISAGNFTLHWKSIKTTAGPLALTPVRASLGRCSVAGAPLLILSVIASEADNCGDAA